MSVQSQRGDRPRRGAETGLPGQVGRAPSVPLLRLGEREPHGQRPNAGADRHDEGHLDDVRRRLCHHPLYPGR